MPAVEKTIGDYNFCNWGSHSNSYPSAYLTAAAAIGMRPHEVETFLKRLDKVFSKFKRKHCAPVAPLAPVDLVKEDLEEPEAASNQSGSSDASPMSTRGQSGVLLCTLHWRRGWRRLWWVLIESLFTTVDQLHVRVPMRACVLSLL